MNCESTQENVYEYLDGSLSPSERTALRAHLDTCAACRETVEREMHFARCVSSRMERAVEDARLLPRVQQRIAAAAKKLARSRRYSLVPFRMRFALGFAFAAVIIGVALVAHHRSDSRRRLPLQVEYVSTPSIAPEIAVNLDYCEPTYTFLWEGDTVVDALVCERHVTDASLTVKN